MTTDAQIVGEFLPFMLKMTPFFGSMLSVAFVFVINNAAASRVSRLYEDERVRDLHRFLSHK